MSLSLLRSPIRPDVMADMGEHDFCYCVVPHEKDAVTAKINRMAYEYNVPLQKGDYVNPFSGFEFDGLILQACKKSENGEMIVLRLSEQDGLRGKIKLPKEVKLLNMLEDVEGTASEISYSPFEILSIGIDIFE